MSTFLEIVKNDDVERIKENNVSVQQNLRMKFYRTIMTIRNNVKVVVRNLS